MTDADHTGSRRNADSTEGRPDAADRANGGRGERGERDEERQNRRERGDQPDRHEHRHGEPAPDPAEHWFGSGAAEAGAASEAGAEAGTGRGRGGDDRSEQGAEAKPGPWFDEEGGAPEDASADEADDAARRRPPHMPGPAGPSMAAPGGDPGGPAASGTEPPDLPGAGGESRDSARSDDDSEEWAFGRRPGEQMPELRPVTAPTDTHRSEQVAPPPITYRPYYTPESPEEGPRPSGEDASATRGPAAGHTGGGVRASDTTGAEGTTGTPVGYRDDRRQGGGPINAIGDTHSAVERSDAGGSAEGHRGGAGGPGRAGGVGDSGFLGRGGGLVAGASGRGGRGTEAAGAGESGAAEPHTGGAGGSGGAGRGTIVGIDATGVPVEESAGESPARGARSRGGVPRFAPPAAGPPPSGSAGPAEHPAAPPQQWARPPGYASPGQSAGGYGPGQHPPHPAPEQHTRHQTAQQAPPQQQPQVPQPAPAYGHQPAQYGYPYAPGPPAAGYAAPPPAAVPHGGGNVRFLPPTADTPPPPPSPGRRPQQTAPPAESEPDVGRGAHRTHWASVPFQVLLVAVVFLALPGPLLLQFGLAWVLLMTLAVTCGAVAFALLAWWNSSFGLREDHLVVHSGLLRRHSREIPLSRLQAVDVVRPLLMQVLGLAELRVELAGGDSSEIRLRYLTWNRAERLRATLLAHAAGLAGTTPEAPEWPFYRLPFGLLLGALAFRLPVLGAVMLFVLLIVAGVAVGAGAGVFEAGVLGGAVPLLLGLMRGFLGPLMRYTDFYASLSPDGLRLRYGIFQARMQTVPPGRVQAVRIVEPLLWRALGVVRVEANVAGYVGERQMDSSTLLPVVPRRLGYLLVGELFGGADGSRTPMHPAGSGLARDGALGVDERLFVARRGLVCHVTEIVPHTRTQTIRMTAGPLSRRRGVAAVDADTPPGPIRARAAGRDIAEARRVVDGLAAYGHAARQANAGPERWATRSEAAPPAG